MTPRSDELQKGEMLDQVTYDCLLATGSPTNYEVMYSLQLGSSHDDVVGGPFSGRM